MYRVSVLDANGVVATSGTAHSLSEAAALMLAYAATIHDDGISGLLDANGEANIQVRGMGGRELDVFEKAGFSALLEEHGGTKLNDDGPAGTWNAPAPGGLT